MFERLMRRFRRPASSAVGGIASADSAVFDRHEAVRPGIILGNEFVVHEELGRGGHGRVFLCEVRATGKLCAIKVILGERLDDISTVQMMRDEIRRWVEIGSHPHIVTAYGLVEHARLPCLVMDHVPDVLPLNRFCRPGAGDWRVAMDVGAQVASALDHGWQSQRLIHRDVKPANILADRAGRAWLTDFGVAVARLTETDEFASYRVGTLPYIAPEIWSASPRYGPASDIYALGVTLYEIATGRWPYDEPMPSSEDQFAAAHLQGIPADPRRFAPDMPTAAADILLACLSKPLADRPADCASLAARLDALCIAHLGRSPVIRSGTRSIDDVGELVNQSTLYEQLGFTREALETARLAVDLAPGNVEAQIALGNAHVGRGQHDLAIEAFRKAGGRAQADDVRPIANLARAAHAAGDGAQARQWLDQAVRAARRGRRLGQLDAVSNVIVELMPPADALQLCDTIVAADPRAVITWNNRAILCRRMGRLADAATSARRALDLNPLHAKAWANFANTLLQLERYDEARQAAERAIEIEPRTAGGHAALAGAYFAGDDTERAEQVLRAGLEILPGDRLLLQNLDILQRQKQDQGLP